MPSSRLAWTVSLLALAGAELADANATTSPVGRRRARVLCDSAYEGVAPLPRLPVVDLDSEEHPEWRHYLVSVYPGTTKRVFDLNTFTWFYWSAPVQVSALHLCDWEDNRPNIADGTPWIGGALAWRWGPEHLSRRLGFQVYRDHILRNSTEQAVARDELEVMRVDFTRHCLHYSRGQAFQPRLANWLCFAEELGQAWWFGVVGSGIFLTDAPARKRLEIIVNKYHSAPRVELRIFHGTRSNWPSFLSVRLADGSPCGPMRLGGPAPDSWKTSHVLMCDRLRVPLFRADDPVPRTALAELAPHARRNLTTNGIPVDWNGVPPGDTPVSPADLTAAFRLPPTCASSS